MIHERLALPALACAVSYPIAILGLLGTLVLLKIIFRIDPEREAQQYAAEQRLRHEPLKRRSIVVEKPTMAELTIGEICRHVGEGLVISLLRRAGREEVQTALRETHVQVGDTLLAVGTELLLERCELLLGKLVSALFFGILLGVVAGSIPTLLPSFPHAVRLGLAGGRWSSRSYLVALAFEAA